MRFSNRRPLIDALLLLFETTDRTDYTVTGILEFIDKVSWSAGTTHIEEMFQASSRVGLQPAAVSRAIKLGWEAICSAQHEYRDTPTVETAIEYVKVLAEAGRSNDALRAAKEAKGRWPDCPDLAALTHHLTAGIQMCRMIHGSQYN